MFASRVNHIHKDTHPHASIAERGSLTLIKCIQNKAVGGLWRSRLSKRWWEPVRHCTHDLRYASGSIRTRTGDKHRRARNAHAYRPATAHTLPMQSDPNHLEDMGWRIDLARARSLSHTHTCTLRYMFGDARVNLSNAPSTELRHPASSVRCIEMLRLWCRKNMNRTYPC